LRIYKDFGDLVLAITEQKVYIEIDFIKNMEELEFKTDDLKGRSKERIKVYDIERFPLFAVGEEDYKIKILAHTFD
jgi:hypothetical protein